MKNIIITIAVLAIASSFASGDLELCHDVMSICVLIIIELVLSHLFVTLLLNKFKDNALVKALFYIESLVFIVAGDYAICGLVFDGTSGKGLEICFALFWIFSGYAGIIIGLIGDDLASRCLCLEKVNNEYGELMTDYNDDMISKWREDDKPRRSWTANEISAVLSRTPIVKGELSSEQFDKTNET